MPIRRILLLACTLWLVWSARAWACPDCVTARAARDRLCEDPDRWLYALAIAAPFVIAGFAALAVHDLARRVGREGGR